MKTMKKEQLFGLARHLLTILGGAAVAKGYMDEEITQEVIGVILTIFGIAWSIKSKIKN